MKSILREEVEKTIQVGYEGKKQPKGDIKKSTNRHNERGRITMFCPKCDVVMKKRLDNKMWRLYGHCFDCQIDFEHKLRVEGKYDEWKKQRYLRIKGISKRPNTICRGVDNSISIKIFKPNCFRYSCY